MTTSLISARKAMPRGWLSLALLGWGYFTDAIAGALIMAAMLEALNFSPIKWALTPREFHRAADLTSVLFVVITIVQFSRYSVHGIYEILTVAPYCFYPLLLAQRASTDKTIPMSALFFSLRRTPADDKPLDIAPHYIVICILAASTTDNRSYLFIGFCVILIMGLLAAARPHRYARWQWAGALIFVLGTGAATQYGVVRAQGMLEESFIYWLNQFPWTSGDPNRAMTAIGSIGRLKLSDQIRVRVAPDAHVRIPLFLQEATYDEFKFGSWHAREADFEALDKLGDRNAWVTSSQIGEATTSYEITVQHRRELTVLPVPRGTRQINSPEIAELQQNRFGTLLAESPPGALRFRAIAAGPASIEPPPTDRDLKIPDAYAPVIAGTANDIQIGGDNERRKAARIRDYFLDNFTYSLVQRGGFGTRTPLAHFLTTTRRGHCEYFATAAVLLLRHAGIPARYAVGYVVEDYSDLENAYIARARHAHAWALAYIDNEWTIVDATPSVWYGLENAVASRWQDVQDLAAWLWYRVQRLNQDDFDDLSDLMIWLVPPLALVLYFRLRKSPLAVNADTVTDTNEREAPEYAAIEALIAALGRRGLQPARGETTASFLHRAVPRDLQKHDFRQIVSSYYRMRYSVRNVAASERQRLADLTRRFLDESDLPG